MRMILSSCINTITHKPMSALKAKLVASEKVADFYDADCRGLLLSMYKCRYLLLTFVNFHLCDSYLLFHFMLNLIWTTSAPDTLSTCLVSYIKVNLGWGHTNYDIQIIVVILKVTTRFFQWRPWIIGKIIMIVLGSHMPNMNYEVYCGSASIELTTTALNYQNIYHDSSAVTHVFSHVYYSSFLKKWLRWRKLSSLFFNPLL